MKFVTEKAFARVAFTENISGKLAQPIHEQAQNYDRQNFHKLSFGPAGLRYVSKYTKAVLTESKDRQIYKLFWNPSAFS